MVRVGTRVGRRGPIVAEVAGAVQRAGADVTCWDEVQRRLGKSSSTSRIIANAIGVSKSAEGAWVRVTASWESPTFGANGTSGVAAGDGLTASASCSGIPLVVVTSEIVSIIGVAIDDGTISTFFSHSSHRRNIGPVGARATTPIVIARSPCRGVVIDVHTGVEGVSTVVVGGVVDVLDCSIGRLGGVGAAGGVPDCAIREVGLSSETVLVVETVCRDVEVEILGHPALVVGEFCHPIEFAVTSVGETVGLADGGGVTDFRGHVLHVGDLGEVGDIGGVSHYRHHHLVRISS